MQGGCHQIHQLVNALRVQTLDEDRNRSGHGERSGFSTTVPSDAPVLLPNRQRRFSTEIPSESRRDLINK
jgi:hypothetical protein